MNFRPEDPVTLGQVIRAAVMIHRIYTGSTQLLSENNGDYQCYLDYVYIHDNFERQRTLEKLCRRLENEKNRAYKLHRKMQEIYLNDFCD